jgi:multidrug resistance efflux pump
MRGEELVGETIMLDVRRELINNKMQADTALKQAQEGVEKAQTAFKQARTAFEKAQEGVKQAQEGVKQARTTFEQAQAAVDRPRSKYCVQKYDNATSTYTYIPEEDRSHPDPILFNAKKDEIHNNYSFVLR